METAENNGFVYEFGEFVLDPANRVLSVSGRPIHLPAKEFDTLLLLVQNNGRALSKDQMMSALWQDAFVEESNLAKQISKLRKLLSSGDGDNANIETIPKHGYRFSAELRLVAPENASPVIAERRTVKRVTVAFDDASDTPSLVTALPPKPTHSNWPLAIFAFSAVSLVALAFYWVASRPLTPPPIKSIAVLPLRSLTPGEDIDALALGLTDSLITDLGSIKELAVRPIGSVRGFSSSTEDALAIGRKLNVDAVLDGTIQESGGRFRINARLISTANGEQLWTGKFEDTLTNMFQVQDRISEQAARALVALLTDQPANQPGQRLTKRYTENPAAFDFYLKGRYHWNKRSEAAFRRAVEYFNRAVELDPSYALAHSGIADSYVLLAVWGTEPPASSMELAKHAALKALEADPNLAEAHTSLAFIKWVYDWDFAAADSGFGRAIELNPNYATARHWRAYYLVSMGRGDEAVAEIKRARELEGPLSLGIMTDVGEILAWSGRYDEAIDHLTEVITVEPNYAVAHYELGIAYLMKNRIDDAIAELERAGQLESAPRMTSALAYAYGVAGRTDQARVLIAELEGLSANRYVSPFSIAVAHAGLGDAETAMSWLEKAQAERSDAMAILKVHPFLLSLHSNPRFAKLAREVGFGG